MAGHNYRIKSEQVDGFFEAILMLKTLEECYRFFEDICTVKEVQSIAQRLEVAKLLTLGNTYNEIEKKTGAILLLSVELIDPKLRRRWI